MSQYVDIAFKGPRDYIQIADIFTAMINVIGAAHSRNLLFSVHAPLLTSRARIENVPAGEKAVPGYSSRLDYLDADGIQRQIVLFGVDQQDTPEMRRPFDEAALQSQISLSGQTAQFSGETESSFAELVTSMNKKLLSQLFPRPNEKWWAVRLKLDYLPDNGETVTLTCLTTQPGRIYNSSIAITGGSIGEISFVSRPQ